MAAKKTVVSTTQCSVSQNVPDAWNGLAPIRRNFRVKLLEILFMESKGPVGVESAMDRLKLDRTAMASKSRQNNGTLCANLLDGSVTPEGLMRMSSEELQTEDCVAEKKKAIDTQNDSGRIDWYKANKDKMKDMCGIKGVYHVHFR